MADILRRKLPDFAATTAIAVDGGPALTYAEVDARSSQLAHALAERSLRKGDRVAVTLPNDHADWLLAAYFACHKLGCVYVPISQRAAPAEVQQQLADAGARLLIADGDRLAAWHQALPAALSLLAADALAAAVAGQPAQDPNAAVDDDDLAEILYTSGTTGRSKGVAVRHGALTAFDEARVQQWLGGGRFLNPLPLQTFAGSTYLLFCVRAAMTNVVMPRFDPHRFADLLETGDIRATYAVSTMWLLLLKQVSDLDRRDFSGVRVVQFGAAPMPPSAVLRLCDLFPAAHVGNLYGLTEAGLAGCALPLGAARTHPASVGKPLANTDLRIADAAGRALPPGSVGEIWLRSRTGPRRTYLDDPEATAGAWDDEGWLHTGDLGYVDDEGFVYLVDRKKDLIIRGGHNIASLEVEDALFAHPDVRAAAVVGVPHDTLGEDVVACIVTQPGADPSDDTLRAFLLERLADYKVPRRYERFADLPRNALGKVLKRTLRDHLK